MDKVAEKNMEVTFADGTNDGEAVPKRWIAALVKMNCEKQVSNKLAKLIGVVLLWGIVIRENRKNSKKDK